MGWVSDTHDVPSRLGLSGKSLSKKPRVQRHEDRFWCAAKHDMGGVTVDLGWGVVGLGWPKTKRRIGGELELKLGLREKILGFIRLRGTGSIKINCRGGGSHYPLSPGCWGLWGYP